MTRTVKEWIEFLSMGDNHYIGLEMENGVNCPIKNYLKANKCLEEFFEPWSDAIVVRAYVSNLVANNNHYHLLVFKKNEE